MQLSRTATPFIGLATLLALGLAAASPASAQIVTNGSFETPGSTGASYTTYDTNATFGGWTVDSGSVDLIHTYWKAQDGVQSVDLSGNTDGAISQTLTTTPGTTYNLSYWLAGNPDGDPTVKTIQVSLNGTPVQTATFDTKSPPASTHDAMKWTHETVSFTAGAGSTTTLQFKSIDAPYSNGTPTPYGPALDNVSVTVAPEPSAFAPFAFAALGLGALVLKARKGRVSAV